MIFVSWFQRFLEKLYNSVFYVSMKENQARVCQHPHVDINVQM